LFLTGFSQGGHATFAVQRELEKSRDSQYRVTASAAIAGPFHLREVSFPQALSGASKSGSLYLAYIANSYSHIYGRPLNSLLTAPYVEMVPDLFNGDHTAEHVLAGMPDDPRKLFDHAFLAAYDAGKSHWFLDALAENNVDGWTPSSPVRIYYGDDDVDVLPEEARRATAAMKQRGADVTAISVGACEHNESALRAIPLVLRWFNDMANQRD
jgi:hypothetical protein